MKSCLEEDAEVWLSPVDDPKRKTRFTWEMIRIGGNWVGGGVIPGLEGITGLRCSWFRPGSPLKALNTTGYYRLSYSAQWNSAKCSVLTCG